MHNPAPANMPAVLVSGVQNELDTADKGLNYLHQNLLRLRERLGPVLRSPAPQVTATGNTPKPTLVPLAEAIATRNEALRLSNRELEDILELLDL